MKRIYVVMLAGLVLVTGCTSKSRARAEARAAFEAGRNQALTNALDARRVNIRFIGPVRNPEVVWTEGLTLVHAIAAAGYSDSRDPGVIVVIRQRQRIEFSPQQLERAADYPLEPGDTVELHP